MTDPRCDANRDQRVQDPMFWRMCWKNRGDMICALRHGHQGPCAFDRDTEDAKVKDTDG